jgi:EAL domain-containing protein (putative c-di-GMP-specific phosphodiesterase class I)
MGFDTGNKVLVEVAARFRDVTANELDGVQVTVGRISGDQFALFISGYDSESMVTDVIRKYAAALEKRFYIDNYDFYITAGFGYVLYPDDSQNADSLRTYAVAAMKESKQSKSNEHILRFSAEMFKLERTIEIEREIRNALKNDTIYFNLQPQYDMDHNLRGFEALARMKDSQGRFISPGEFIPVSEKVGLIDKVDGTVFRKAAFFFGELIRSSGKNITLSINVSVKHMMKSDFLDEVRTVLKQSGVPASLLEIEITESIMIDSAEKALSCINELKKMGIKIAIDDFGTGYSSLSYLNCFPANILKIDKSFIDKMNTSDPSKQYVAAIISIGHIMGFDVISEGVEEPDQLDTLRDIGCDYIQGYIWGRPLPEDEARKLVLSPDQ